MQFETILEFNGILTKIKQNLSSQHELTNFYSELNLKLKIFSQMNQKEIVFQNLMMRLIENEVSNIQKVTIIKGALSFAYFSNDKNIEKRKLDPERKSLYLKMLEAAYPEFTNRLIKKEDLTKDSFNKISDYLLCLNQISQAFADEDGCQCFEDNLLKFFNDKNLIGKDVVLKDLVLDINLCFGFISEVTKREAEHLDSTLQEARNTVIDMQTIIIELEGLSPKYDLKKIIKKLWIPVFGTFLILFSAFSQNIHLYSQNLDGRELN